MQTECSHRHLFGHFWACSIPECPVPPTARSRWRKWVDFSCSPTPFYIVVVSNEGRSWVERQRHLALHGCLGVIMSRVGSAYICVICAIRVRSIRLTWAPNNIKSPSISSRKLSGLVRQYMAHIERVRSDKSWERCLQLAGINSRWQPSPDACNWIWW